MQSTTIGKSENENETSTKSVERLKMKHISDNRP